MIRTILLACLILISVSANSQTTGTNKTDSLAEVEVIMDKVEMPAQFPGGLPALRTFLAKNLDANEPVRRKAPDSTYKVIVRFVVARDGSIQDIKTETNNGYGMEEEVIRVIKKMPRWIPAMQNGRVVKAYRRQPVLFVVMK